MALLAHQTRLRFGLFFFAMPNTVPTISIIIPVLNEVQNVESAVANAALVGDEVIVVDGGSKDGTWDLLQGLCCKTQNGVCGRGQQLRSGAESATGDLILFLHADARLDPAAKSQLVDAWSSADDAATFYGGFRQRIDSDQMIFRLIEKGNQWRAANQRLIYGDQGIFVSRQLYDQVDGVPGIPLMEDFEFSRRLSKAGKPVMLEGPIHVSQRRWQKNGAIRQTFSNWWIATKYRMGVSPEDLRRSYNK